MPSVRWRYIVGCVLRTLVALGLAWPVSGQARVLATETDTDIYFWQTITSEDALNRCAFSGASTPACSIWYEIACHVMEDPALCRYAEGKTIKPEGYSERIIGKGRTLFRVEHLEPGASSARHQAVGRTRQAGELRAVVVSKDCLNGICFQWRREIFGLTHHWSRWVISQVKTDWQWPRNAVGADHLHTLLATINTATEWLTARLQATVPSVGDYLGPGDGFWRYIGHVDLKARISRPPPDPDQLLRYQFACRIHDDQRLCRYAADRSAQLTFVPWGGLFKIDPPTTVSHGTIQYKILSWWGGDRVPFLPSAFQRRVAIKALVQSLACWNAFECDWKRELFTFDWRPAGWIISDIATPWCWRAERDAGLPAALHWLKPVARAAGAVLCDRALIPPAPDLSLPDPPGQTHLITMTGGSSPCIGSPFTPVCALETYKAANFRHDIDLWRATEGLEKEPFWIRYLYAPHPDPNDVIRFRILSINRLTEWDIPPYMREDSYEVDPHRRYGLHLFTHEPDGSQRNLGQRPFWRPGDVQIEITTKVCGDYINCSLNTKSHSLYTLRRVGPLWRVVDTFSPL